jgi:hypothetical protein
VTTRDIVRKLRAWDAGRPLPRYDTLHHAVMPQDQVLIVAFVRMAGESRPWALAWGHPGADPSFVSVPDGRVRDDVAEMCAGFAEVLLEHLRVHNWTYDPVDAKADPSELRQVWVPNGQHVAMLHQLSYTYSQTKFGGINQDILRALGRVSGWLFREASRTGSQHLVSASQALGEAYAFPAQDARTAHLGYQLAWLTTDDGGRDARVAAAQEAERLPVSPTMDPRLERHELSDLVDAWQRARREGGDVDQPAAEIELVLRAEALRRWKLTEEAYSLLADNDRPVNPGVRDLVAKSHREFDGQHQRIELRINDPNLGPAFVAHPETDFHGSSAASRYLIHAAADEAYAGYLIHDDPELFREACDAGRAVQATVQRVFDLGVGKSTRPHWVVVIDPGKPHRLRENGRLVPHGSRGHTATVTEVAPGPNGLEVTLEWTGRKTMPISTALGAKPGDSAWEGADLAFVTADAASLTEMRSRRVWKAKDGPGAWLTHGRAPAPTEITTDDGATDLIVDDISQIEEGAQA